LYNLFVQGITAGWLTSVSTARTGDRRRHTWSTQILYNNWACSNGKLGRPWNETRQNFVTNFKFVREKSSV